jgi:hypothetical protein
MIKYANTEAQKHFLVYTESVWKYKLIILAVENIAHPDEFINTFKKKSKWPLVRERTIPTEPPPLVDET